jgi:hypothetical protein
MAIKFTAPALSGFRDAKRSFSWPKDRGRRYVLETLDLPEIEEAELFYELLQNGADDESVT